jgi:hypothetical protein
MDDDTQETPETKAARERAAAKVAKIAELEAQYRTIAVVNNPRTDDYVVLRTPTRGEYKMFRANASNPQKHETAQETLVRQIAVYPDAAGIERLFDGPRLALDQACAKALVALMGTTGEESLKG